MTTLRIILDDALAGGSARRYAREIARALLATAPAGATVAGVVAASPESDYLELAESLPGLARLEKSALARRELTTAWRRGLLDAPGSGFIHAPSLLAPLRRHAHDTQLTVTIQDAVAWTHPELLPGRSADRQRALARRAERYADAVVVPSHAVAARLGEHLDLGDRVRVVPIAAATAAPVPSSPDEPDAAPESPGRFVMTVSEWQHDTGLPVLARALARVGDPGLGLLVVTRGRSLDPGALADTGLDPERLTIVAEPSAERIARIHASALAYLQADAAGGLALGLADALAAGIPVVHGDLDEFRELSDGGSLVVPAAGPEEAPALFAEAIEAIATDRELAARLSVGGRDRARLFRWEDAAEQLWQLHAEL